MMGCGETGRRERWGSDALIFGGGEEGHSTKGLLHGDSGQSGEDVREGMEEGLRRSAIGSLSRMVHRWNRWRCQGGAEGRLEAAGEGIGEPHGTRTEPLVLSVGLDRGQRRLASVTTRGEEGGIRWPRRLRAATGTAQGWAPVNGDSGA
jgi:hypothetical protein